MNIKKIAFIICVNNKIYFEECCYWINNLKVPQGLEIDIIDVQEATSMCAAYNLAMQNSDAKYKIYLHQDVFIANTEFIQCILDIFTKNEDVGMIGMAGGIGMPKTGVTYLAWNVGIVDCRDPDLAYHLVCGKNQKEDIFVDAVDGLLIATQYDIPWREDLFHDFDFYDVSQSFEMRKKGYKIVVPYQEEPWVIHDSSFAKLNNYDKNRKICQQEYSEFLTEDDGFEFTYNEEWEQLSDELAKEVKRLLDNGDWKSVTDIVQIYRKNKMKNSLLEMYGIMCDIYPKGFFKDTEGYEEIYKKYVTVRFLLRRMEKGMSENSYMELIKALEDGTISCDAVITLILHCVLDKEAVLAKIEECYKYVGKKTCQDKISAIIKAVQGNSLPVAYSKRIKNSQ